MFNKNVGTFDCFPNFVFKTGEGNNQKIHDRYQMTTKARQVCQEHQLNCLTVPRCSLIEMNCNGLPTAFLVEEKYDIKQGIPAQKNRYANEEEYLQEIARQLTILVCLTGFKDVKWDNISLMGDPPDLKVLLCDLEPHTYVPLKEAFIGWQNRGFGQNTPGLFVCLPKHAEMIYQTAEKHLPKTTFETIKGDLEKGKTQAKAIITKRDDIKTFHQTHGVKKESPAIPDTFLDTFGDDERLPRAILELIIEDINTVIRKQSKSCFNLVDARGWRLTGDCETADSNWRQYICDHRYEIEEKLLPKLKEQGIIHSFVSSQQFRELPYTTLPGRVDELDMFIQF